MKLIAKQQTSGAKFINHRFRYELESFVEQYIRPEVKDKRLIAAFAKVPRQEFVLPEYREQAYVDSPLPIGEGQTISQPSLVARMVEELRLKGNEKVLEVGTGSGYQTAILAELAKEVYSIERIKSLADKAREVLKRLGYKNVWIFVGDGSKGWVEKQPFDGIIVSAAADKIPQALTTQLKEGGRLVIPVRELLGQTLKVGIKRQGVVTFKDIEPVIFVPLIQEDQSS